MAIPPAQREWLLVIAGIAVAGLLWNLRGRPARAGDVVDARITLTTADRDQVGCALDRTVGPWRCAFASTGETVPAGPAGTLAPYLTTTRVLYLVPALFHQGAVAARTLQEPPEDRAPGTLGRFVAHCQLRLHDRVDGVRVRWVTAAAFGPPEAAWAAEPVDCRIEEP